ncbi:MAG: type II toxin-antitoxin system RelB/DinJ family antitoxin [Mailhella sp.]|nr:type II toxin-antitoxin system RelB/DinJ family antitoxin [Mailhella sp.]
MATSNINVRVDSELKAKAESLFSDLGMTMSTAIVMFLKSAVSHDGLPFEVRRAARMPAPAPPFPNTRV